MKKMKKLLFIGAVAAFVTSCTTVYPVTATNNPIGGKVGTSETSILFGAAGATNLGFGLVTNSDYGVIEAAKKGGINKVATVDIEVTDYIVFRKAKLIVTGE
jgi:hypothetical protein